MPAVLPRVTELRSVILSVWLAPTGAATPSTEWKACWQPELPLTHLLGYSVFSKLDTVDVRVGVSENLFVKAPIPDPKVASSPGLPSLQRGGGRGRGPIRAGQTWVSRAQPSQSGCCGKSKDIWEKEPVNADILEAGAQNILACLLTSILEVGQIGYWSTKGL